MIDLGVLELIVMSEMIILASKNCFLDNFKKLIFGDFEFRKNAFAGIPNPPIANPQNIKIKNIDIIMLTNNWFWRFGINCDVRNDYFGIRRLFFRP